MQFLHVGGGDEEAMAALAQRLAQRAGEMLMVKDELKHKEFIGILRVCSPRHATCHS
jgi:hypothetical protein